MLADDPGVDLDPWLEAVNRAGVVPPLERMTNGLGHVADVCDGPSWDAHLSALQACAVRLHGPLKDLVEAGARVVVDTAVHPEDRDREWLLFDLGFPPDLLAELSAAGIGVVISFYAGLEPTL
ncbi:MAG: hypothetical protein ACJ72E_15800 [Marmoricola sp.]